MTAKFTLSIIALTAFAACDTATPPTAGQAEFNAATVAFLTASGNPVANPGTLPGSATYNGKAIADANLDGETGYSLIGDMAMNVDFSETANNVTGQISSINVIDQLTTDGDQLMQGTLNIAGSSAGGNIAATATGQLSAVLADSIVRQTGDFTLQMTGAARSSIANADTVAGTFTGTARGTTINGLDGTILNGRFYGTD